MDNVLYAERKVMIFQNLLQVDNEEDLSQIESFIAKFLSRINQSVPLDKESKIRGKEFIKKQIEKIEEEDEIFDTNIDENLFLEDFNLSVGELREKVKLEENGEKMTKEEFFESYREWRAKKDK